MKKILIIFIVFLFIPISIRANANEINPNLEIREFLQDKKWIAYGSVEVKDENIDYVVNFDQIDLESNFPKYIDMLVKKNKDSIEENQQLIVDNNEMYMIQASTENSDEYLESFQIGTFDTSVAEGDVYIVKEYLPKIKLIDSEQIDEDGSKKRVVLYYLDQVLYKITKNDEEKNNLNIKIYVPSDDSKLDDLKLAIEFSSTNEVMQEIKESFNFEEYKPIDYVNIMRDRSGKPGYKDTFYAEVLQYEEGLHTAVAIFKKDGDHNQLYYAVFNSLPKYRLVEGDNVDVYGTLDGLYTYETVIGGSNTVPKITIDRVLIEGIDY